MKIYRQPKYKTFLKSSPLLSSRLTQTNKQTNKQTNTRRVCRFISMFPAYPVSLTFGCKQLTISKPEGSADSALFSTGNLCLMAAFTFTSGGRAGPRTMSSTVTTETIPINTAFDTSYDYQTPRQEPLFSNFSIGSVMMVTFLFYSKELREQQLVQGSGCSVEWNRMHTNLHAYYQVG